MNRLFASDFKTLASGGVLYDKTDPVLKPDFDKMWKHVTALAKHVHDLISSSERPFPYEIGKSRNYLQQAGRGRFYYPKYAWIRYIRAGHKRTAPSVSMSLNADGIEFSIDFSEKYAKNSVISRARYVACVERSASLLTQMGVTRDADMSWPRHRIFFPVEKILAMKNLEFDVEITRYLYPLLEVYESMWTDLDSLQGGEEDNHSVSRHINSLEAANDLRPPQANEQPVQGTATDIALNVAQAALAVARGERFVISNDTSHLPSGGTVLRRRRSTQQVSERRITPSTGSDNDTGDNPPSTPIPTTIVSDSKLPANLQTVVRKPRRPPEAVEQVSLVPPAVPEHYTGLDELRANKNVLIYGATGDNLYGHVHNLTGALLRDQLSKTKKRHELILDALSNEEFNDLITLALYEAPRGLTSVALQTHELVLGYYRREGHFSRPLRTMLRQGLAQCQESGLVSTGADPNQWLITPKGRTYIDAHFRYALQEASKAKPRRYVITDYAVFLSPEAGSYPPMSNDGALINDEDGIVRQFATPGPVIELIQKAIRDRKNNYVIAVMGGCQENLSTAFGPLIHLLHKDNRGNGALAESIHISHFGNLSFPPNVHVIIALTPGADPSSIFVPEIKAAFTPLDYSQN
ncbi:MAG: hypothetical protein CMH54_03940 [Myxococcales bacterium]|nr:hypothetical protein [Myxococcales bacterium]